MNQNQIIRQLCQLNDKVNSLSENGINSPMPIENPLLNQQITDLSTKLNTANVNITKLETVIKNTHKENHDQFIKISGIVLKLEQNTTNIEKEYLKVNTDYTLMKKNYIELSEKVNALLVKSQQPP